MHIVQIENVKITLIIKKNIAMANYLCYIMDVRRTKQNKFFKSKGVKKIMKNNQRQCNCKICNCKCTHCNIDILLQKCIREL